MGQVSGERLIFDIQASLVAIFDCRDDIPTDCDIVLLLQCHKRILISYVLLFECHKCTPK